jgi:hypothetical protein
MRQLDESLASNHSYELDNLRHLFTLDPAQALERSSEHTEAGWDGPAFCFRLPGVARSLGPMQTRSARSSV